MRLKLIAEDLPISDNRVVLREGEAETIWNGHSAYGRDALKAGAAALPDLLPFGVEDMFVGGELVSEDHIQGTHRMGVDPDTSVVDDHMRCHGVSGLYAPGAGAFPTSSPANPTLTLSALALRAGRAI